MEGFVLELNLPCLEFLNFENVYSGCYEEFNFKIKPKVSELKFEVFVWNGLNCLEESKSLATKEFELSEQGREQAQKWIVAEFRKNKK